MTEVAYLEFYDCREEAAAQTEAGHFSLAKTAAVLRGGVKEGGAGHGESKIIAVPFRPASLRFQSTSEAHTHCRGDISKPGAPGKAAGEQEEAVPPGRLTMSFSLVFDRTIYEDNDVTPQVEGLLAAVRNPFTRQVSFHWGNVCYRGSVLRAHTLYEMFGKDGSPVRAKVDLTMTLSDAP